MSAVVASVPARDVVCGFLVRPLSGLASTRYLPRTVSLEVFPHFLFYGRVFKGSMLIFFKHLEKFTSEVIWSWASLSHVKTCEVF